MSDDLQDSSAFFLSLSNLRTSKTENEPWPWKCNVGLREVPSLLYGRTGEKMTIFNEAVRLFFAVSALVLVGLLSAPMGGMDMKAQEITAKVESQPKQITTAKGKNPVKVADRKGSRKISLKKG